MPISTRSPHGSFYRIKIEGKIRPDWSDWLDGMEISAGPADFEPSFSILVGSVADQAALRGILCKLWDLNLTILSIERMQRNEDQKEGEK